MGEQEKQDVQPEDAPKQETQLVDVLQKLNERLEKLESPQSASKQEPKADAATLDELLQELAKDGVPERSQQGRGQQAQQQVPQETPDLERMTSTQLANFVVQHMHTTYFQPLVEQIELIRIRDEIKDAAREAKANGEDFADVKNDVFKVLEKRPNLTVREAYKLVKSSKPRAAQDSGSDKPGEKRDKTARTLADLGERPSVSRAASSPASAKTIREAAERAWDEVMEKA